MGLFLKQSTAVDVIVGPFVDETDGKTAETALTITQAEVRLSKNGGNMAQKNEATSLVHDELGYYDCNLDATDTNTLGRLQLMIHESGALPVYHEYMVVTANVYDTLCSTDLFQTDLTQIGGVAQSATDLKDFADAGYDPATNKVQGVVLTDTTTTNTDLVTAAAIADAVWDEVITAAAHAVADSGALYLRQLYQTLVSSVNQAQAGAAGSITLAAGESAVNDFFKGQLITLTAGTGKGQSRACYGYTGASKVALIRPNWATAPDATSWYAIGNLGSAVIAALEDIDLSATMKTSVQTAVEASDLSGSTVGTVTDVTNDVGITQAGADKVWGTAARALTDKAGFSLAADQSGVTVGTTNAISASGIDSIWDEVIEGTLTGRQTLRLNIGVLAGKSSGGGTATLKFRDSGDAKDRVTATVDANGNRTAQNSHNLGCELMALVVAGYWHTTYWAESYWQQDWWLEYGTYVPPAPPTITGETYGAPVRKPKFPVYLLTLIRDFVEAEIPD